MKRTLPFIIIIAVLVVAVGAGWYLTRPTEPTTTIVTRRHRHQRLRLQRRTDRECYNADRDVDGRARR